MSQQHVTDVENEGNDSKPAAVPHTAWRTVWLNHKGVFLIILAQAVGSSMDAIVRFLQQGQHAMHPFQVIFARMGMTFLLSTLYMWWEKVPDFPLGNAGVRGWLILRASSGFFGLFCLYYSVHYLPLAEATVFRFLTPIVTAWACSVFLGQVFTKKELTAGLVALIGVVFIAHPRSIFGRGEDDAGINLVVPVDNVTTAQRLLAIAVSLIGVVGQSGAYTMIRVIGNRAHALISVNYFAVLATVGSASGLLIIPGIGFTMPRGAREWVLLALLGVLGFVLQFLLTAGLQLDKSSKATSMLYTGILFALSFDWAIWGVLPGYWSLLGGSIIIASTLWSALQKPRPKSLDAPKSIADEESALLGAQAADAERAVHSQGLPTHQKLTPAL